MGISEPEAEQSLIHYSVIIPVFQAHSYIAASVARVVAVMEGLGTSYEILLVNDNSTDGTWDVLQGLKLQHTQIRIFKLDNNIGQTPATLAGSLQAKGKLIITLDDDLQHPPEEITKLIAAYNSSDVDIVFGDPENRHHAYKQHPTLVSVGTFLFHKVFMRKYRKLNFFTTFRLFNATLLKANGGTWSHLFFIWQLEPERAIHITTRHEGRTQGTSNHTLGRLIRHFGPFLWYFAQRTVIIVQVLLLVGVIGHVLYKEASGTTLHKPHALVIMVVLMASLLLKAFINYQLKNIEERQYAINEG